MKYKKIILTSVTIITIVISIALISLLNAKIRFMAIEFFNPFLSPIIKQKDPEYKPLEDKSKPELIEEIKEIKTQQLYLKAELLTMQTVNQELQKLKQTLKINLPSKYKPIYAEVYLRDPLYWYQTFSLNKGKNDGVKAGAIVLANITNKEYSNKYNFAVIGKIITTTNDTSTVETILSSNCRISVTLEKSQAHGVLEGSTIKNKKPTTKIKYLPSFKTYRLSEKVLTSGLSINNNGKEDIPPGLLIGKIAGKNSPAIKLIRNLDIEAEVEPAINFDLLHYVIILVPQHISSFE